MCNQSDMSFINAKDFIEMKLKNDNNNSQFTYWCTTVATEKKSNWCCPLICKKFNLMLCCAMQFGSFTRGVCSFLVLFLCSWTCKRWTNERKQYIAEPVSRLYPLPSLMEYLPCSWQKSHYGRRLISCVQFTVKMPNVPCFGVTGKTVSEVWCDMVSVTVCWK